MTPIKPSRPSSAPPPAVRRVWLTTALLCAFALAVALWSQHAAGMRPCAWCVLQRLILVCTGIIATLGFWLSRRKIPYVAPALGLVLTALGASGIAAAWYQYTVAATQFSCAQTFADRFMTSLGLDAALPWLFGIYASCMDARVDFLGMEYALWGLGLFVVTTALGAYIVIRSISKRARQPGA